MACPFTGRGEMRVKSAKRIEAERHFSASRLENRWGNIDESPPLLLCCVNASRVPRNITQGCHALCSRSRPESALCECMYRYTCISLLPLLASVCAFIALDPCRTDSQVTVGCYSIGERGRRYFLSRRISVKTTLSAQFKKRHVRVSYHS